MDIFNPKYYSFYNLLKHTIIKFKNKLCFKKINKLFFKKM